MALNESISGLLEQGMQELTNAQISFGLKLLVIFGVIYLMNISMRTGGSIISMVIYVIAFIKWVVYKMMGKDV